MRDFVDFLFVSADLTCHWSLAGSYMLNLILQFAVRFRNIEDFSQMKFPNAVFIQLNVRNYTFYLQT